jgi:hypothetical protein
MEHGTWNMEHGTWNMEHGTWNMEHGTSRLGRTHHPATINLSIYIK